MDQSATSARSPFQESLSRENPSIPYRSPDDRSLSAYGRSLSSSGPSSPRLYGTTTPPERPSSPARHHRRTHSAPRPVKETLNAELQEDEGVRRVNHYILKREIGRGSFGVVHLGIDSTTGEELAIKEFSKSKLRKRSQSMILRRTHIPGSANPNPKSGKRPPFVKRRSASEIQIEKELNDPLHLVRGEIAIMKKLNHENVVKLVEVLDDPTGDSLYMVMEYCKHGPVMDIGLDGRAPPCPPDRARNLFRDLILGMEYLHAQGIVHRDIKPDNLLLNSKDVLKIVDFGVSEIFTKDDRLTSTGGSPAFTSPELSGVGISNASGKAADIWAMGITLYALIYGYLPFSDHNILELYDNIRNRDVHIPEGEDPNLVDLFHRILDKNPQTRIKMPELREHPWVTANGLDPLLSTEENTVAMVTNVSEKDYADAIKRIRGVVRAVAKLKALRNNSLSKDSEYNPPESNCPHANSLDFSGGLLSPPPPPHQIQSGFSSMPPGPERASTEPTRPPGEYEAQELIPIEPPLTPKIQVLAPPDEPPEDEIKYIGVGLGTVSTADKKRRRSASHGTSEPNPTLGHRDSSESLRSDTSLTSGQLTPAEPMVYASPTITHENVFEHAFQRAEDKIRLMEGEHVVMYNTWRSEEMKGQPVSNERGRAKVEFKRADENDDDRPRWERVLKEKWPEKLAEINERAEDKKAPLNDSRDRVEAKDVSEPAWLYTGRSNWERLFRNQPQIQLVGAMGGAADTLGNGLSSQEAPSAAESPPEDKES